MSRNCLDDGMIRNQFKNVLIALGLHPTGVTLADVEALNKALSVNSGTPSHMILSPQDLGVILKTFNK